MDRSDKGLIGFAALMFAWLVIGLPLLYLPTSEQHKTPHPSVATQSPGGEPKGTQQSPFYIKVLPGEDAAEKAAQEAEDREEKKDADKWLVRWTMALFLATIGLIIATGALGYFAWRQMSDMKESLASAKKAADAADRSARAAIGLELARIRIALPDSITTSSVKLSEDELEVRYGVGRLMFYNDGRTPAVPIEIKFGMTFGDSLPDEPVYFGSDAFLPDIVFEPPSPAQALQTVPAKRLTDCWVVIPENGGDQLYRREKSLWFYCCLTYEDFIGEQRSMGRCWQWANVGRGGMEWRRDPTAEYNYET